MYQVARALCLTLGLAAAVLASPATHVHQPERQASPGAPSDSFASDRFAGILQPCTLPDVEGSALCGGVDVWEDREATRGRKIALRVVVLPAMERPIEPDPLVYLAGGGVLPASERAPFFARAFQELRRHRDVLLVDQRGSGGSNALDCDLPGPLDPDFRDEGRYLSAISRCRTLLEPKADLRFYTTPHAMADLDEVRRRLGYERLNLYGMSYGTKAAMVYLRQFPDRVRTVALHGLVPLDTSISLDTARSAQDALERVFDLCAQQPACAAAFPRLRDEFRALMTRLAAKPVDVEVKEPSGAATTIRVDAEIVARVVHGALYSARAIEELPRMIHRAFGGDLTPIARRASGGGYGPPKGVLLTIQCTEELPRVDPGRIAQETAETFVGGVPLRRQLAACQRWVTGRLPEGYWSPVRSALPILPLTGALDHATPRHYGDHVVATLAAARHLVLPGRGHNDVDACVTGLIQSYVLRGSLQGLDTSCAERLEPLSFATSAD